MTKRTIIYIGICLFTFSSLFSQNKVQLVPNFAVDAQGLNAGLSQYSSDIEVEITDLRDYPNILKKKKAFWQRVIQSLSSSPISLKEGVSKIVFWNINNHYLHHYNLSKLPKDKLILFMWEPPIILQKMHTKKVASLFSKIYTWDDELVDNQTYFKFYYPVLGPMIENLPSFEEKKLCAMFCSNYNSKASNELYSERKKAIDYFENIREKQFDFYGKGWDSAHYSNYRGWIDNKIDAQKNYRFIICYENTHNISGYITEKIFDCFKSGSVPIYWGASNIDQYIPKDCFIDRRNFSSIEEVYAHIKNIGKEEYEGYIKRIRAFLSSDQAKLFSAENFFRTFFEAVNEKE